MNHQASTATMTKSTGFGVAALFSRFVPGDSISALLQKFLASVRRAVQRERQRRNAIATYHALNELDNRTLHDLGFDRSEITSVAAEVTGEAEYTRMRGRLSSYGLPR